MKPRVFIGSSSEGLDVAYAIQSNIDNDAEVTVWTQDVFRPSQFILESLMTQLGRTDYGIFIFSADDVLRMRDVEHTAVRDNVIFEVGLWIGRLGRNHSFIVAPRDQSLHLPSDLLGINLLTYQPKREDDRLEAALGPACNKLRAIFKQHKPQINEIPPELMLSIWDRRDIMGDIQRRILGFFEFGNDLSFSEVKEYLPSIPETELAYRIDNLRLQMFLQPTPATLNLSIYEKSFRLSDVYADVFNARGWRSQSCDFRPSYDFRTPDNETNL